MAVCKDIPKGLFAGNFQYPIGTGQSKKKEVNLHHTKAKADVGLAKVIADLMIKGCMPCIPLSEHQPYDLVVVLGNGEIVKVQVKYARLKKNGTIDVKFRTSWTDKQGTHIKHYREQDFDYYAIYCPEKEQVLYIPNVFDCPKSIRFNRPANNQNKNVKWANAYMDIRKEPSETICHTPVTVKT